MSTFQRDHPHRDRVSLFPVEEQDALTSFLDGFPEALDLAFTNPALAVALANARDWDTFRMVNADQAFVGGLLRQRRRRICGALGFPASERVVRNLSKIQPQACDVNQVAGIRWALRNPEILSILSHLATIGPAELRVAADLGGCSEISFRLFTDLATRLAIETDATWVTLVRQIKTVAEFLDWDYRMPRSVVQARRYYFDLWCELVDEGDLDPGLGEDLRAGFGLPPVPLPGNHDIEPIDSAAELIEEARAMKHCVLTYAERVAAGHCYLYRVMHPERATVLIGYRGTTWHLDLIAGVNNQPVSSDTEALVASWFRRAQTIHHD